MYEAATQTIHTSQSIHLGVSTHATSIAPLFWQSVLLFESGQVLLLSEYEADEFLSRAWVATTATKARFVSLSYLREAYCCQPADDTPFLQIPRAACAFRGEIATWECTLAGLQLLAGDTAFTTQRRKEALASLLPSADAKRAGLRLAALRGLQHMISRSNLEQICDVDIGEV